MYQLPEHYGFTDSAGSQENGSTLDAGIQSQCLKGIEVNTPWEPCLSNLKSRIAPPRVLPLDPLANIGFGNFNHKLAKHLFH